MRLLEALLPFYFKPVVLKIRERHKRNRSHFFRRIEPTANDIRSRFKCIRCAGAYGADIGDTVNVILYSIDIFGLFTGII
jgi:hypothetical protein